MRARYGDEQVSSARKTRALRMRVNTSAAAKITSENLARCMRLMSGIFILVGFIGRAVVSVVFETSREAASSSNLRPLLLGCIKTVPTDDKARRIVRQILSIYVQNRAKNIRLAFQYVRPYYLHGNGSAFSPRQNIANRHALNVPVRLSRRDRARHLRGRWCPARFVYQPFSFEGGLRRGSA